jgi:hypothetical protein
LIKTKNKNIENFEIYMNNEIKIENYKEIFTLKNLKYLKIKNNEEIKNTKNEKIIKKSIFEKNILLKNITSLKTLIIQSLNFPLSLLLDKNKKLEELEIHRIDHIEFLDCFQKNYPSIKHLKISSFQNTKNLFKFVKTNKNLISFKLKGTDAPSKQDDSVLNYLSLKKLDCLKISINNPNFLVNQPFQTTKIKHLTFYLPDNYINLLLKMFVRNKHVRGLKIVTQEFSYEMDESILQFLLRNQTIERLDLNIYIMDKKWLIKIFKSLFYNYSLVVFNFGFDKSFLVHLDSLLFRNFDIHHFLFFNFCFFDLRINFSLQNVFDSRIFE